MDDRVVYRGRSRTIEWAVMPDGKLPGLRDWRKLRDGLRAKAWTVVKRLGNEGRCENQERFKHERNGIYAIKGHQVRVYCFMASGHRIVLTNAVEKKRPKARSEDLKRAEQIRQECVNK